MNINHLSYKIIGCAMKVHTALGPGLLESVYEKALEYELEKSGLEVKSQVALPFVYEDIKFDIGFRLDLLVEDTIIIELKSVETLADVHHKQLLTYLKLTGKKLGLLMNFNSISLKDSIVRIAHKL